MFRLQNNVPEVYVQSSRDFQLLCRLYDAVFQGVRYSIDSLKYASNTKECNKELLPLLATKLGFFTQLNLSEDEFKSLLQVFPIIIRHKGSVRGINEIITLFQRISKDMTAAAKWNINTVNKDDRVIQIIFSSSNVNEKLLLELLQYVLPAGYSVTVDIATEIATSRDSIALTSDQIKATLSDDSENRVEGKVLASIDNDSDSSYKTNSLVGLATIAPPIIPKNPQDET